MPVEGRGLGSRRTHDVVMDLEIGQPINSEEGSETADGVIPIALSFDRCPLPGGYRGHAVALGEERIPSLAACLDDVLVALPDPHAELIATQILPDVLDRVELGRVGR